MWTHYRGTFFPIQVFIVLTCVVLYFSVHLSLPAVLVFFVVMQVGGFLGAVWAARLKRRVNAVRDSLPLK